MQIASKVRTRHGCFRPALTLAAALCAIFLLRPTIGSAQTVTAALTGRVTDATGAALVGAKVTVTDTDRGTVWPTVSNGEGVFSLPRLPIGTYSIRVEQNGFQAATQSNIQLQLNQVARLDFRLNPGSVHESVEVTGGAPLLQTDSTLVGQVIDARLNAELPLATRNYVQLTLLAPGSIHPDPSAFKNGQGTGSNNAGRPNVNGNREQANNFMLDGLDNNQVSDNLVGYVPSVDAIQEFNEITLTAPAEFGNYMGAIINATTKSGVNQLHGSAFEFFRNDKLNANNWGNNFRGGKRGLTRWNSFGATLGGPIIKDKLFFFADYQGQRLGSPASVGYTNVYTQKERTGDFSELGVTLYDPFSSKTARNPYPGNVIPASEINRIASQIINSEYYPAANRPGMISNYAFSQHGSLNGDQGDAKIDWNPRESDHAFLRFSQSRVDNVSERDYALNYNSRFTAPTHTGVLDWTHTITPSMVNDARVGVNYVYLYDGPDANGLENFAQTVGIPDVPSSFLPAMRIGNGNVSAFGTTDGATLFADSVIQYEDTLLMTKGTHTMRFGFQGFRYRVNTYMPGNGGRAGVFYFRGYYTTGTPGAAPGGANGGAGDADFLLGLPDEIGLGVHGGTWGQRSNSLASFFQDDWRVTSTLTLNLGVRWELHTPWYEVNDRQANFDLVTGEMYTAGKNGASRALYNQYNGITNFQPRVGVAWTPRGSKFVIRAGYSLSNYLEGTGNNLRLPLNPPFAVDRDNNYQIAADKSMPGSTLTDGFTPFTLTSSNPFKGATLRVWNTDLRPAVSNQWNVTVQRQLSNSLSATAAYVGQRSTHLMVPMAYFQKVLNADGTVSPTRFLAGNPELLSQVGQLSGTASVGNQSYNSMQLTLQQRLTGGLQFSASYTYSNCMTDNIGYYEQGGQASQFNWYFQNVYNQAAEWGPCGYDVRHNMVGHAVYDLPFGRDRKFGKGANKIVDAVAGGWQAGGIVSVHGGFPLSIGASDASGTGSLGARANCIAPAHVFGRQNSIKGGYQWFDPSSYAAPAAGTFGTCGVGTLRGPGLATLDFNLMKSFPVADNQHFELRGEFMNLFNTPILNAPGRSIGTNMGLLQSAQGERNVQLALKYVF